MNEHPDVVKLRERDEAALAVGYAEGDVNHNIQPIIGWLRLLERDGKVLYSDDLGYIVEKLDRACTAEFAWLALKARGVEAFSDGEPCGQKYCSAWVQKGTLCPRHTKKLLEKIERVEAVVTQFEADEEESLNTFGQHLMGGAVLSCAEAIREALK